MFKTIYEYLGPTKVDPAAPAAESCPLAAKEERVRTAYRSGLFSPFRTGLQNSPDDWSQRSLWTLLETLARGASIQDALQELEMLNLFVFLQEPLSTEMAKQSAIEQYLASLTKEEQKDFFYSLSRDVPACIAVAILQYASLDVCQEVCTQSLKHPEVRTFEEEPCNWFREVFTNPGLYPKASLFFDRLFSCYSEAGQKELTYYLFLHSDAKEQQMFLNILSPSLRTTIEGFTQEIKEHLRVSLDLPLLEGQIKIPFQGRRREYFLYLFLQTALDHPASFRIVAKWNEDDWEYFKAQVKEPRAVTLALKWTYQMVQLLSMKEKEGPLSHEPGIWLFFQRASNIFPKRFSDTQRVEVKKIMQELSASALAEYYSAFDYDSSPKPLLQELSPSQIVELFTIYITEQKVPQDPLEKVLAKIWNLLRKTHGLQNMCQFCFLEASPLFGLTIYSSLSRKERLEAIAAMSQDRDRAIQIFADWCILGLSSEAQTVELSSFVKFFVSFQLPNLLAEIDPFLSTLLKKELDNRQIDPRNLAQLFPETSTSEKRQEQALNQLSELLSREDIDHNQRRSLIDNLRKDLRAGTELTSWVPKLFERLPKEMWPLLFVYFSESLCVRFYDPYSEEKTRGGMFKSALAQPIDDSWKGKFSDRGKAVLNLFDAQTRKEISEFPLHAPKWLPNTEEWIDLAAHILILVVQNPLMNESDKLCALRHLHQAMCETKTIDRVISCFCEIGPAHTWIPALDLLQRSAFNYNKGEFYDFIAQQICSLDFSEKIEGCEDQLLQGKVDFIAERFVAFNMRGSGNFIQKLFDKPFIQTPEEASLLVDALIQRIGVNFLGYFLNRAVNTSALVKGVRSRKDGGQSTFLDWLQALAQTRDENRLKISILESIGAAYAKKNPEEFIALLQSPEFSAVAEEIRLWYAVDVDTLMHIQFPIGWRLLMHFSPDAFYPTVFAKLLHLQEKKEWFDIVRLFKVLSNLPCSEELAKRLLTEDSMNDFRKAFQQYVKDQEINYIVSDSFIASNSIGQTFLFQLVPDWSFRLVEVAMEILEKEYEEAIFYDHDEETSSYDNLTSLYSSLDKVGVLATWLSSFEAALPERMKSAFLDSKREYERNRLSEQ